MQYRKPIVEIRTIGRYYQRPQEECAPLWHVRGWRDSRGKGNLSRLLRTLRTRARLGRVMGDRMIRGITVGGVSIQMQIVPTGGMYGRRHYNERAQHNQRARAANRQGTPDPDGRQTNHERDSRQNMWTMTELTHLPLADNRTKDNENAHRTSFHSNIDGSRRVKQACGPARYSVIY